MPDVENQHCIWSGPKRVNFPGVNTPWEDPPQQSQRPSAAVVANLGVNPLRHYVQLPVNRTQDLCLVLEELLHLFSEKLSLKLKIHCHTCVSLPTLTLRCLSQSLRVWERRNAKIYKDTGADLLKKQAIYFHAASNCININGIVSSNTWFDNISTHL